MAKEEEDAVELRDVKMRIDGAVEQWKIKLLTKRSSSALESYPVVTFDPDI